MRKLIPILLILSLLTTPCWGEKMGNLRIEKIPHAFGGHEDQGETLACEADTWTHITNAGSNLWSGSELSGIGFVADEMIIYEDGDYNGVVTLTLSAVTGKDFHVRVYNTTQTKVEGTPLGISTTGTGNKMQCTVPIYIEGTKGDVLQMQLNSADGSDPVLNDAIFYVQYLHS